MSIESTVIDEITKLMDLEAPPVPTEKLKDIFGINSLDWWEFVCFVEDLIGEIISDEDLEPMITIQDMIDYVEGKKRL